jgi:tetratricopeptide (TPR) repeat protein
MTEHTIEPSECTDPEAGKLIHHYEMGQLEEPDRGRFEEHLMVCPFCAAEAEAMHRVATSIRANRNSIRQGLADDGITFQNLRQKLSGEPRDPHARSETGTMPRLWKECRQVLSDLSLKWKMLGAGGAVVLSAAVVLLLVLAPPRIDEHIIPLLSFQALPYEGSIRIRGESQLRGQSDFDTGMQAYGLGDYAHAIPRLQRAVDESPDQGLWWLYLGVSCFLQQDAKSAITSLRKSDLLITGDNQPKVRWFLAQSYLLAGKRSEALPLLNGLASGNNEYSSRAADLRTRLSQMNQ